MNFQEHLFATLIIHPLLSSPRSLASTKQSHQLLTEGEGKQSKGERATLLVLFFPPTRASGLAGLSLHKLMWPEFLAFPCPPPCSTPRQYGHFPLHYVTPARDQPFGNNALIIPDKQTAQSVEERTRRTYLSHSFADEISLKPPATAQMYHGIAVM